MCDLFGMSCNQEDRATQSLPRFAGFSVRNPHGWGVGWYEGGSARIERAPGRADYSEQFLESIEEARSTNLIAHVRYATHGNHITCNCHPFVRQYRGRDWMFAHNGWVNEAEDHPMAEGDTDSEQIFNHIMDEIECYQSRGEIRGTLPALKHAIATVFERYGDDINLNLLISDGSMMYAFHHYPAKPMYLIRRSKSYGGAALVSTRELTGEHWIQLEPDRLLVLDRGEVLQYNHPLI
jgi:predicted glutamine amidotransferase|tara:strand:+ start:689 stop:1399 length:711 start_codon:yes stop_codon:yes gene_type:complete